MELSTLLEERIQQIRLRIHHPDGSVQHVGHKGPGVDWHLHHPETLGTVLKDTDYKLCETYGRGEWDVNPKQLTLLMEVLIPHQPKPRLLQRLPFLSWFGAHIPRRRRTGTPAVHWQEISLQVSRLCLGEELFQGPARYQEPGFSLEQAQRNKCNELFRQLRLKSGQRILDLSAGWGSLALWLAEKADVRVTGLVANHNQLRFAQNETLRRGLQGQVQFRLGGLYHCRGTFDRILAMDFLEQYPEPTYPVVFQRLQELLKKDGFAWMQTTGRTKRAGLSNRWYQNQLPSHHSLPLLSSLIGTLENTRLQVLYAQNQSADWLTTLEDWGNRFSLHRADINRRFGDRQTRKWELLLASQITALRWRQLNRYEFYLGNERCSLSFCSRREPFEFQDLPMDVVKAIPGLDRDS